MNWSYTRIALGYNCHMMNIIQQVTDPMPMNLSYIALLLVLSSLLHLLQIIAIIVTVTATIITTIKTIILLCY